MLQKLIKSILGNHQENRQAELYRNLIRHEAKIGGKIFGPIPKGGHREFFCLDERTWVWHEEWIDANHQHQTKTTRYDIRPNAILKAQDGGHYQSVGPQEAKHLRDAVNVYQKRVKSELYHYINP